MDMEPIVVTGMGIISALGIGIQATLKGLKSEKTGIDIIRLLQTQHKDIPVGEVPYTDEELKQKLGYKSVRPITRTALLGRVALREAVEQAHLCPQNQERIALISGTTVGGMEKTEAVYS